MAEGRIGPALIRNYLLAKREDPSLRKGQYMMEAFPGRFDNEQSAYQAFNQTTKGKRGGERLYKLANPPRTIKIRGERRPTSYQAGLWKAIIHFNYIDQDGNLVEDQEISFNMQSSEHDDLLAVPYLRRVMLPIAEEYLAEKTRQSFNDAQITYLEIIPINTYHTTAIDLDELYI